MCLSSSSLDQWIANNPDNRSIPPADMAIAARMYSEMWPKLNHSRNYCLNPLLLAAELLEFAGIGQYPNVKRFKGDKGKRNNDTLAQMFSALVTARPA